LKPCRQYIRPRSNCCSFARKRRMTGVGKFAGKAVGPLIVEVNVFVSGSVGITAVGVSVGSAVVGTNVGIMVVGSAVVGTSVGIVVVGAKVAAAKPTNNVARVGGANVEVGLILVCPIKFRMMASPARMRSANNPTIKGVERPLVRRCILGSSGSGGGAGELLCGTTCRSALMNSWRRINPRLISSYCTSAKRDQTSPASSTGKIRLSTSVRSATRISHSTQRDLRELGDIMTIKAEQDKIFCSIVCHQRSLAASRVSSIHTAKP